MTNDDAGAGAEPASPPVTVAVCSYDRPVLLKNLLLTLLDGQQGVSSTGIPMIVVENSPDPGLFEQVVAEFGRFPNISVYRSFPPGVSRARNVALEACETPYIAYLDDDAVPAPEWYESLTRGILRYAPGMVAGPIYPDWPGPEPEWLPQKYVGCLTILDHGNEDRWLTEEEFAFGANMAFRVDALREIGGFNLGLGPRGDGSLLTEEEIEAQIQLRQRGHNTLYVADAGVAHKVHENRQTRNYFRARMSWQAVSSRLRNPPQKHFGRSQHEVRAAAEKLGVGDLVAKLVEPGDGETFSAQLDLIHHFFALMLEAKSLDDAQLENALAAHGTAASSAPGRIAGRGTAHSGHLQFGLDVPINPSTRHLIVEGRPAHFFLYSLYGDLPQSQLLLFPHSLWHDFTPALDCVARSLRTAVQTVTFVTLEPLIYGPTKSALIDLATSSQAALYGILHRLPETGQQGEALCEVAPHMAGIFVMAERIADILAEEYRLENVSYLPPHAALSELVTLHRESTRRRIGATDSQIVFSVLGEARRGKGIELLLQALKHVPAEELQGMFFLIAGRLDLESGAEIERRFAQIGVPHYLDLRLSKNVYKYDILTNLEFGTYVAASDAGLLLYRHQQQRTMSGVAPNYIAADKPLVSLADSVIGQTVADHGLGFVVDDTTPAGIALTLRTATRALRKGWKSGPSYARYRESIGHDAVLDRLSRLLNGSVERAHAAR